MGKGSPKASGCDTEQHRVREKHAEMAVRKPSGFPFDRLPPAKRGRTVPLCTGRAPFLLVFPGPRTLPNLNHVPGLTASPVSVTRCYGND